MLLAELKPDGSVRELEDVQKPLALGRETFRSRLVVIRRRWRAVAAESVGDVEVLLEVVAQRDVYERTLIGDKLHRGRESALRRVDQERAVDIGDPIVRIQARRRVVLAGGQRRILPRRRFQRRRHAEVHLRAARRIEVAAVGDQAESKTVHRFEK